MELLIQMNARRNRANEALLVEEVEAFLKEVAEATEAAGVPAGVVLVPLKEAA